MMAKLCLYKRYHLLNNSLDNRVSFSSALSELRRFFLRSLSLRLGSFRAATKTVRHASLCPYLGVWIIVSPLPPRFLKRDCL